MVKYIRKKAHILDWWTASHFLRFITVCIFQHKFRSRSCLYLWEHPIYKHIIKAHQIKIQLNCGSFWKLCRLFAGIIFVELNQRPLRRPGLVTDMIFVPFSDSFWHRILCFMMRRWQISGFRIWNSCSRLILRNIWNILSIISMRIRCLRMMNEVLSESFLLWEAFFYIIKKETLLRIIQRLL